MSASRYPGATFRALPENTTEPVRKHTQLIFHSAVSAADSLWGYFSRSDVTVESHFYVQDDGDCEQYIDATREADANYKANPRALSVETWDNRDPNRIPWNDLQMDRLVDIAVWAHREKGIPLVRAPRWDAPGMGGHSDYPMVWTNVRGKTCPGTARKPQVEIIIARARAIIDGSANPASEDGMEIGPGSSESLVRVVQKSLVNEARASGRNSPARIMEPDDSAAYASFVDGDYGPVTAKAVAAYQAGKFPATGRADLTTQVWLLRWENR